MTDAGVAPPKRQFRPTQLSCRSFAVNAVLLQLHALASNLGNFLRTLATPVPIKDWSLTTLKEKLIKVGPRVVTHARYVAFEMAEVALPKLRNCRKLHSGFENHDCGVRLQ
jgi:hypothetical protein